MVVSTIFLFVLLLCTKELHAQELMIGCPLDETYTVTSCTTEDGTIITDVETNNILPYLAVCEVTLDNVSSLIQCTEKGQLDTETHKLRQKRRISMSSITSRLSSGRIAAGSGIFSTVGIVGGFLYQIFGDKEDPPNTPPSLTCPSLSTSSLIFTKSGETSAQVSWSEADAHDKEDGDLKVKVSPSNFMSGATYEEGKYVVSFSTRDKGGLSDTCSLVFEVKVKTCATPTWPENGNLECSPPGFIHGTICTLNCLPGYRPESQQPITCGGRGNWNPPRAPSCLPISCNTQPKIDNGHIECVGGKAVYMAVCSVICDEGFRLKGLGTMMCETDGSWKSPPTCEDRSPPRFTSCPDDIQVNIDSKDNTALVSWDLPKGTDNSGVDPVIEEIHGHKPNEKFTAGVHALRYQIQDSNKNWGNTCSFTIKVFSISCEEPDFGEHMHYDCPDFYRFGAECSVSCKSGYPNVGVDKIQCLNPFNSRPPQLKWTWDRYGLRPFCKETICPNLTSPVNGALACNLWGHGTMCQLQCQEGFDVPLVQDGMYVCGESNGKWRPDDNVPNCNPKRNAQQMHLRSEFFYYTGKCNSSEKNLDQIRNNFVVALNTSKYYEMCVGVPECHSKYVSISCGPINSRRKREADHSDVKRSAAVLAYRIEFDLVVGYQKNAGKSFAETFADNEDVLNKMVDAIHAESDGGHFDIDVGDLRTDSNSFGAGHPELLCPEGTRGKQITGSCVGCPTGRYLSNVTGRCLYCPVGFYQDSPNSISCKACPSKSNTTSEGSTSINQCLGYCSPGQFSKTGLVPCQPCPSEMYQPRENSKRCRQCTPGTRSPNEGSNSSAMCLTYDVLLNDGTPVSVESISTLSAFVTGAWYLMTSSSGKQTLFSIKSSQEVTYSITRSRTGNISATLQGKSESLGFNIKSNTWTHLAVAHDSSTSTLTVYKNGQPVYTDNTFSLSSLIQVGDFFYFDGDMKLSSFFLSGNQLAESRLSKAASSCSPAPTGALYTTTDISAGHSVKIVIPSTCDAIDECQSSPCGGHECINRPGSYQCVCHDGYSGSQCEIAPDFCEHNDCMNGATCVSGIGNYTCECLYGYKGSLCEQKAVDGQWSVWGKWSTCSESCGGGQMTRVRRCDSPPADPEGQHCLGNASETITCNDGECPVCLKLRRPYGVNLNCTETTETTKCTITCREGLDFATPPLPEYECGMVTNYTWTHQTKENPNARLPSCSDVKLPSRIQVAMEGNYDSVPCTQSNMAIALSSLESRMSSLDCIKNHVCEATVVGNNCNTRKKRSAGIGLSMKIQLESNFKSETADMTIERLLNLSTGNNSDLSQLVKPIVDLEKSAEQIFNHSKTFFEITVAGKKHSIAPGQNGLSVTAKVTCPLGYVQLAAFCAECPTGSYSDGRTVKMCPKGEYQDRTAQSHCKPCPGGKTTPGIGSTDVSECSDIITDAEGSVEQTNGEDDTSSTLDTIVGVTVTVGILVFGGLAVVFIYKYNRKKHYIVNGSYVDLNTNAQINSSPKTPVLDKTTF